MVVAVLNTLVPVDGEVKPHELSELRVIISEHVSKIGTPVKFWVNGAHGRPIAVQIPINDGRYSGEFGDQVHRVFVTKLQQHNTLIRNFFNT